MTQHFLKDDIVFAITTGYYPQMASEVNYMGSYPKSGRPGKQGSTGGKYALVSGWSANSIRQEKYRFPPDSPDKRYKTGIRKWDAGLTKGQKDKKKREHRRQIFEDQKSRGVTGDARDVRRKDWTPSKTKAGKEWKAGPIEAYKWIGGSDKYRIFGDQIWYMHGVRRDKILMNYVDGFNKGDFGAHKMAPNFQNIYSKTEPKLIEEARTTANLVFNNALDEVQLEEAFESGAAGEITEMGYKAGDYEYMPYAQAKAQDKGYWLDPEMSELLDKKVKDSAANVRDMVKVQHTNKGAVMERIFDVTEMSLGEPGQHGIVETSKELKTAIKSAIATGGDPKSPEMKILKTEVEQMFIKAITNDYNPVIVRMKEAAEKAFEDRTGKKKRLTDMKAIVKEFKEAGHVGKKGKVRVEDIASASGMKLVDHARRSHYKDAYSGTALKYVTHMLATWGDKIGNDYTQAHRVGNVEGGQSIYAFVKMKQYAASNKDRAMEFWETAPAGKGTWLLTGYSATLALSVNAKEMSQDESLLTSYNHKRGFMMARATGSHSTHMGSVISGITNHPGAKPQMSTQIFTPSPQSLNKMLQSMLDDLRPDQSSLLTRGIGPTLKSGVYGYNATAKRRQGKLTRTGHNQSKAGFWALPYVGIMTSEHVERKK